MVKIRSMTKNAKTSLKNRRTYRKRVSVTKCRDKTSVVCRVKRGCKLTHGKKRSYCRKSCNTTVKNIFSVIMYLTYYPLFNNYTIIYII